MKLVVAIVQDADASHLISALMTEGFSATRLSTTGGFLRAGNTTLLIGVQDQKCGQVMQVIENVCRSRKQMGAAVPGSMVGDTDSFTSMPIEVTVGGATVFVFSVDQFAKL